MAAEAALGDFESDTRLDGDGGRYRATLSRDWEIWGPNGGYVAAIALRAAGRVARVPRPASFAGHFVSVARFEPVDVEVTPVHQGRRSESLRVAIRQAGRPVLEALVRTAAEGPGLEHVFGPAPDVPDPEGLKSLDELRDPDEPRFRFWDNLEERPLHPERWKGLRSAHDPEFRAWFRFRPRATFDDPFLDAARALLLIDTMSWPAACQPHPDSAFIAPNLDVTAWFHAAAPESEWLFSEHESRLAAGGLMGTSGRVWSRDGRLLASGGAQLFCVPRPGA
jgi:acyl-CoA thioesterase II